MLDRFKRYIAIETKADELNPRTPSSDGQFVLGKMLLEELKELGVQAKQDEKGFIYGFIPSNTESKVKLGLLAHLDTATEMSGEVKNPQVHNYKGGDIKLPSGLVIKESEFSFLKDLVGKTIITSDGTTLLGADDKSGITIIMSAIEKIVRENLDHPDLYICFTPDEEIGRGIKHINFDEFRAEIAYTLDGGPVGQLEYDNFNASSATVTIKGNSIHPGSAKAKLVNALDVAIKFYSMLPEFMRPEYTENREGFFMLRKIDGDSETSVSQYLIRDHDAELLEKKKDLMKEVAQFLNYRYGYDLVSVEISDTYKNMKEKVLEKRELIDVAKQAYIKNGIEVEEPALRGGTDGAQLTEMGLPCPNLFTGGYNFHGPYELIALEDMQLSRDVVVDIVDIFSKR